MRGMRHAIAAMAGQGNNLIVDDVIFNDEISEYRKLLSSFDLHLVGVMAPLEVLEEREAARADRLPGLARWQYERVHKGTDYDLEVDTSRLTPLECARRIRERFRL
jgi:chloramphenicol 3-O phosphotransferase